MLALRRRLNSKNKHKNKPEARRDRMAYFIIMMVHVPSFTKFISFKPFHLLRTPSTLCAIDSLSELLLSVGGCIGSHTHPFVTNLANMNREHDFSILRPGYQEIPRNARKCQVFRKRVFYNRKNTFIIRIHFRNIYFFAFTASLLSFMYMSQPILNFSRF